MEQHTPIVMVVWQLRVALIQITIFRMLFSSNHKQTLKTNQSNNTQTKISTPTTQPQPNVMLSQTKDLGRGYSARLVKANSSVPASQDHMHVDGPNGESWAQNKDGSVHDQTSESPPKKAKEALKEKTGWDWDANAKKQKEDSNNVSQTVQTTVVVGGIYCIQDCKISTIINTSSMANHPSQYCCTLKEKE